MSNPKIQLSDLRYNPELSAFQARAAVHEDGVTYVYPMHVCAPLTAEFENIVGKLSTKTRQIHAKRSTSLHMHLVPQSAGIARQRWAA